MKIILVATDNQEAIQAIKDLFQGEYVIDVACDIKQCLEKFREQRCEYLFIEISFLESMEPQSLEDTQYKIALMKFWHYFPTAQVIVMAYQKDIRKAVMAVRSGASNYITYPIHRDELKHITESVYKALIIKSELSYLRDSIWKGVFINPWKTENKLMIGVFDKLQAVAPMKTTVLLTGDTGTGKSTFAKLIHRYSKRAHAQFIHVHCGAIQDTLIESELFGHEKGAFTGADRRKLGKFEIANNGTIFLDEVGTLSPSAQIKLLQVLQDQILQRVGGEVDINVDVRVIAATNTNLEEMIKKGTFRADLYYRLSVFPIEIPLLRKRSEDIPFLADDFLRDLNRINNKEIQKIDPQVIEAFKKYAWPGNIRELKNLMERAYIIERSKVLTVQSFPKELFGDNLKGLRSQEETFQSLAEAKQEAVKNYLRQILSRCQGNIQKTANSAGISTRQLHKLMKQHGLLRKEFKTKLSKNINQEL